MLLHVRTRGDQHKKRRKKVARQWPKKTIGTFLSQRVQREDNLWVGHRQVSRGYAAVCT